MKLSYTLPFWNLIHLTALAQDDPCQMCESVDAVLANPEKVVPFLGASGDLHPTCDWVYNFASSVPVSDQETCSLIQGQAQYCGCPETSGDPFNACSLCPGGPDSMPGDPNFVAPFGGTCAELQDYIAFMPETECNKLERADLLLRNNWLCKCPDATVQCSLCPDETVDMENPDSVIPYFAIPNNEKPTCAEARDFASVREVDSCGLYKNNAGYCGCPTTQSGDPTEPLNVCSLCPDGSDPAKPDYITPAGDKCSDLQKFVSFLDEEGCQSTTASLITANAFVCGCPGVDEPICDLCEEGSQLEDPERSTENGNQTCGELELAVWTISESICLARDQIIQQARDLCCESGASFQSVAFALGCISTIWSLLI